MRIALRRGRPSEDRFHRQGRMFVFLQPRQQLLHRRRRDHPEDGVRGSAHPRGQEPHQRERAGERHRNQQRPDLHALGVDDSYTDRFAIFAKGLRLGERGASAVIRSLDAFRPTVVVIDNLGGSIPSNADINSSAGVGPTMEVVRQLAERKE